MQTPGASAFGSLQKWCKRPTVARSADSKMKFDVTKAWSGKQFRHERQVTACRFSPCGKYVVAGGFDFQLQRWIDPSAYGWWSGDHHVHASGCAHYKNPTEGVQPEAMLRQALGENLNISSVLT